MLPNGPRDSRTFNTPTGKAMLTVNELEHVERPAGTLILQSMRSHDQFNTTIYGNNDRYRGIKKGREVVFVSPEDLAELGLSDGQHVDVHGVYQDNVERVLRNFRLVSYPTARGCAAAYYPEANVLVPLDSVAEGSQTPVSKAVIVRLEPAARALRGRADRRAGERRLRAGRLLPGVRPALSRRAAVVTVLAQPGRDVGRSGDCRR